jgi:hypothetical protein
MSRIGTRKSPSGPKVSIQIPFYTATPTSATTDFVGLCSGTGSNESVESNAQYRMPAPGKLDTLLVNNAPVGADATNVTYTVRKNGADVGTSVVIANNTAGPVRTDLSTVTVLEGDRIAIESDAGVFGGAAPKARIFLSWTPNGSV